MSGTPPPHEIVIDLADKDAWDDTALIRAYDRAIRAYEDAHAPKDRHAASTSNGNGHGKYASRINLAAEEEEDDDDDVDDEYVDGDEVDLAAREEAEAEEQAAAEAEAEAMASMEAAAAEEARRQAAGAVLCASRLCAAGHFARRAECRQSRRL